MTRPRYNAEQVLTFARALLERVGLESDKARIVAEVLLEGDLLGHTTHGLHLLAPYLADIEKGGVQLDDSIPPTLRPWAEKLGVTVPPAS